MVDYFNPYGSGDNRQFDAMSVRLGEAMGRRPTYQGADCPETALLLLFRVAVSLA